MLGHIQALCFFVLADSQSAENRLDNVQDHQADDEGVDNRDQDCNELADDQRGIPIDEADSGSFVDVINGSSCEDAGEHRSNNPTDSVNAKRIEGIVMSYLVFQGLATAAVAARRNDLTASSRERNGGRSKRRLCGHAIRKGSSPLKPQMAKICAHQGALKPSCGFFKRSTINVRKMG